MNLLNVPQKFDAKLGNFDPALFGDRDPVLRDAVTRVYATETRQDVEAPA
jgi:hypothetical protein